MSNGRLLKACQDPQVATPRGGLVSRTCKKSTSPELQMNRSSLVRWCA